MKNLYIKNYKGFAEEIFELKDVNFFVGENSTGKTSILKLINVINSKEFWFNAEFNNTEVSLGFFDEIKNINTEEKFFRIGIESKDVDSNDSTFTKVLLEFENYKSRPKLIRLKLGLEEKDILAKLTPKQIKFKTKESKSETFLEWCQDFNFSQTYSKINFPFEKLPDHELPLFIVISIISDKLSQKNKISPLLSYPTLHREYTWLAPIRAKAKRIYESYDSKFSPEGDHTPNLLRNLFSQSNKTDEKKILKILNQFGQDSKLFDSIDLKKFGSSDSSPFEIVIKYDDTEIKLPNVGYGVSQCLPLIAEILYSPEYTFSIQQPEVHLHPKAQAAFGSFFYNSANRDGSKFLIETHSDYTINRFRYSLSKNKKNSVKSQILFFERRNNSTTISNIHIKNDGTYGSEIPNAFRDFYIDEELRILEI